MATIRFNVGAAARPFLEAVLSEQENAAEAGSDFAALRDLAREIDRALLRDVGKAGDPPDGFAVQVGVHDLCAAWRVLDKAEQDARDNGFEDGMDRAAFAGRLPAGDRWLMGYNVLPGEVAPEPDVGELVEAALDEALGLIRDAVPAWDSASDDFASRFFDGANGETIMVILREYAQGLVAKGGKG